MGSTYIYLSVMPLPQVQQQSMIKFCCRPVNIGRIMDEQNNKPFVEKPVKEVCSSCVPAPLWHVDAVGGVHPITG